MILAKVALASALVPSIAWQIDAEPVIRHIPNSSQVRINEVCPDPEGEDTLGNEYLELLNATDQPVNISNWEIRNAQGITIHTFGNLIVPGRDSNTEEYFVTVYFGPIVATVTDSDFLDGDRSIAEFSGNGLALNNDMDCVYLVDETGTVVDGLIYGVDEPVGPGVDAVRNSGHWIDSRFNVKFAHRMVPITEGGVLGRNMNGDDYDEAADWGIDGGKNALGSTIGRRNDAAVFDGAGDMIWSAQSIVNDAITIYSGYNSDYLQVIGATHTPWTISDPDLAGGFSVTSVHSFTINDRELGAVEVWSGQLVITFERTTGSSFSFGVSGSIGGSVHTLDISVTQCHTGFGSATRKTNSTFGFDLQKNGVSYPYSNVASISTTWTDQKKQRIIDQRDWTDWSGHEKMSDQRILKTFPQDGQCAIEAEIVRSFPLRAPAFGQPQELSPSHILTEIECADSINGDGLLQRVMSRFDTFVVGSYDENALFNYPSKSHRIALVPSQSSSLAHTRISGDPGSGYGDFSTTILIPVEYFDAQGTTAGVRHYTLTRTDQIAEVTQGTTVKDVGTGTMTVDIDGFAAYQQSIVVDPAVQTGCQCGCGMPNCTCGGKPPEKKEPKKKKWYKRITTLATAGACGVAWLGGPATGLGGTLGSMAMGWIYEDAGLGD